MFNIDKRAEIIIYGVNNYAKQYYYILENNGYSVNCFFDIRAHELNGTLELPVYTIDEAAFSDNQKKNICIILALQNALQQDNVAELLYQQGYDNILFLPMRTNKKRDLSKDMRIKYNYFITEQFSELYDIPNYSEIILDRFSDNNTIIRKVNNNLTVWVPVELIYTNPEYQVNGENFRKYADINISAYYPYVELFKYLSGDGNNYEEYLKDYGISLCNYDRSITNQSILDHRIELFNTFKRELNYGMEFFTSSAPPAEWNSKAYFNLREGQHRSIFLFMMGMNKIPIMINQKDYDFWYNKDKVQEVIDYIEINNIQQVITPIPHPLFMDLPAKYENNGKTVLSYIQAYLGKMEFKGKRVADISTYNSYFARNIFRMGAKEVISIEENSQQFELAKLLNHLLYTEKVQVINDKVNNLNQYGEFDIIFMMGTLSYKNQEDIISLIKSITKISNVKLFWESGININEEKEIILNYSLFKSYKKLGNVFNGIYVSEIGVFK